MLKVAVRIKVSVEEFIRLRITACDLIRNTINLSCDLDSVICTSVTDLKSEGPLQSSLVGSAWLLCLLIHGGRAIIVSRLIFECDLRVPLLERLH